MPGSYAATTFELSGGITGDVLAEGGSLDITLDADGSTSGQLSIPASLTEDGIDVDAVMAGTWSQDGSVVRFDQSADTFVRDLAWDVLSEIQLRGEETFSGTNVTIILERR